jgi:polar amino acid transport system substrate-binding protein
MRPLLLCAALAAGLTAPPLVRGESSLEKIKREGILRWGADPSGGEPFVYTDPNDPERVIGFEVELMDKLAERLGVRPLLVPGGWVGLIDNLKGGRTDLVLNGIEVNRERAQVVRFSVPYFVYVQQLTVRADREAYRTLNDVKGMKVGVLEGSASIQVLRDAGWSDDLILSFDDSLKPYEALRDGRVEAVLAESIIAARYAPRIPGLINQPDLFAQGNYAAALRRGANDDDLVAAVNRALEDMKADGELARIYQRWNIDSPRQAQLGIVPPSDSEQGNTTSTGLAWGALTWSLIRGAGMTLLLTAVCMPLALFFGLILALMGLARQAWLRWPALAYIQVMRGTPLLAQLYVVYFSLPQLGTALGVSWLTWPAVVVGILCLSANYAAYEAEIHRAGLEAVPKGQREAARSLGMNEFTLFRVIVLPQSFRIILPPVVNDLISMLKDSSLVSTIGVAELLFVAMAAGKATFHFAQFLLIAALIYLVMSLAAARLGKILENRLRLRGAPRLGTAVLRH